MHTCTGGANDSAKTQSAREHNLGWAMWATSGMWSVPESKGLPAPDSGPVSLGLLQVCCVCGCVVCLSVCLPVCVVCVSMHFCLCRHACSNSLLLLLLLALPLTPPLHPTSYSHSVALARGKYTQARHPPPPPSPTQQRHLTTERYPMNQNSSATCWHYQTRVRATRVSG
jgi:hypothetical protein